MKKKMILLSSAVIISLVLILLINNEFSHMTPIDNDKSHLYYKIESEVYIYHPRNCGFLGCIGPDLDFLDFFRYERIWGAKPDSFHMVYSGGNTGDILAADEKSVFYGGKRVTDGDVETLEVVTRGAVTYGRDSNNLYLKGTVTKNKEDWKGIFLSDYFLLNDRGLFARNNTQKPTKVDIADPGSFQVLKTYKHIEQKWVIAEDKNFFYLAGSHLVEPKPKVKNFVKLGCGYYKYENKIYYTLFLLPEADPETFRVLKSPRNNPDYGENCNQIYAVDENHRWEFRFPIRPQDEYRNGQVDDLLKLPINQ